MSAGSRKIFLVVALLAVGGMVVSSVSLAHHYGHSRTEYCDFGQAFNCDMVNRSIYSSVMGVPVALIGLLGYAALLVLATKVRDRSQTPSMLLASGVAGLSFALYLTYIEAYVLAVWCILCLSSLALIFSITILSGLLFLRRKLGL